jgi:hypothetical protein
MVSIKLTADDFEPISYWFRDEERLLTRRNRYNFTMGRSFEGEEGPFSLQGGQGCHGYFLR